MPSYAAGSGHRRYAVLGAVVAVVAVALFFFTRHREDTVHGLLNANLETQAREVLVLIDEARSLCLDLASTTLEQRRRAHNRGDDRAARFAGRATGREELAYARGILELATVRYRTAKRTSLRMAPRLRADSIPGDLESVLSLARSLCYQVGQPATPAAYEAAVTTKLTAYTAYRAGIEPRYLADEREREEILARLEPMIEGHRQQVVARENADGAAREWVPEERGAVEQKTPEQLRAERRDLEAEEEWRRRQAEHRESLHREAIGRWREEPQAAPRAMPRLGLKEVDKESLTGVAGEARSWLAVYRRETAPVTVALRRFDMIRRIEVDERTTRACRALFSKVSDLLQSQRLFASPIEGVNSLLEEAYSRAKDSAAACLAGDMDGANAAFDEAERLFARLESDFGLSPN